MTTTFDAIGTRWRLDLPGDLSAAAGRAALMAVRERIAEFDKAYSRFRPDSLVAAMAASAGEYQLPPDAPAMLAVYRRVYDLTGAAVTPLIGQVLADAGYDAAYSLQERPLSQPPAWDEVLAWDGYNQLTLTAPALLDFGAAGKGYLVDLVGETLASQGLTTYTIDAGGDLLHRATAATPPLRVGLEHPADPSLVVGVAELGAANPLISLCGSAGNRRHWGRFHHIIDPRTLASPTSVQAVWVAAPTALVADILTTALFFVPPSRLQSHFGFEYVILDQDYRAEISPGFPGTLFTS
ncbi:MAG TPA: FAD:protein FMN transferase [Candidatus Saccharimonas sp.]|nr:FAD:protein FMN transferase [Candidatus Saccharimonas sp.]